MDGKKMTCPVCGTRGVKIERETVRPIEGDDFTFVFCRCPVCLHCFTMKDKR